MRIARFLTIAVACLGTAQCAEQPSETAQDDGGTTGPVLAETPNYVPIAYMEGYGNPKTGELWVRSVPMHGAEAPEGVGVSEQAVISGAPGFCSVTVASDGKTMENPPGTFEYYTLGDVMGAPAGWQSSFDPTFCANTLDEPFKSNLQSTFEGSEGVGCAYQHVMNFTNKTYDRILLDIDVFNGTEEKHGAYGFNTTPGTVGTPGGRNAPHAQQGLWDFGPLGPGQESNVWIYFKNGDTNDFNWTGYLLGEIYEDCGDGDDEDCDGVDDNGCGDVTQGGGCFDDSDCGSGYCDGYSIVSNTGNAGQGLGDDVQGTCLPNHCGTGGADGDESDVDCGGSCNACPLGGTCNTAADCVAGDCSSASLCYAPGSCGDGVVDAGEECDYGPSNDNEGDCKLDCTYSACGDGFLNCNTEYCDGGGNCAGDCNSRLGPETFTFTGVVDADAANCKNWSPNGFPEYSDTARFDSGSPDAYFVNPGWQIDTIELASDFSQQVAIGADILLNNGLVVDGGQLLLSGIPTQWQLNNLSMSGSGVLVLDTNESIAIVGDATFAPGLAMGSGSSILFVSNYNTFNLGDATFEELRFGSNYADATLLGTGTVAYQFIVGMGDMFESGYWGGNANIIVDGAMLADIASTGVVLGSDLNFTANGHAALYSTGLLAIDSHVEFAGESALIEVDSGIMFNDPVDVTGQVTMAGDAVFNSGLNVYGALDVGGHNLSTSTLYVDGYLLTYGFSSYIFATSMLLDGNAYLDGGSGTITVDDDFDAYNAFDVYAPMFLTVGGNFTVNSFFDTTSGMIDLTADQGSASVYLDGATLNELVLTNTSGTYSFDTSAKFDVGVAFSAVGGPGDTLTLQSMNPGTQWSFDATGATIDIDYVSVEDSDNQGTPILPPNFTDLGNNRGWGPQPGYFVMSDDAPSGNLGGRMGADMFCLDQLTSLDWKGKSDAIGRGLLTPPNVHAWLCDGSGCATLMPDKLYAYASVQNPIDGGTTFLSSPTGLGPGDDTLWEETGQFGYMGFGTDATVWTGRGTGGPFEWAPFGTANNCGNWLNPTLMGTAGLIDIGQTGTARWSYGTLPCNSSEASIICMVHPGGPPPI